MTPRSALALGLGAAAVGGLLWWTPSQASVNAAPASTDPGRAADSIDAYLTSDVIFPAESLVMDWKKELDSGRGEPYAGLFASAEQANTLPVYMLARLAWQESHYRADIISGAVKSRAGAVGIMQIVPKWHPNVDALDPVAAIQYAGTYLRSLYRQFGTWKLALMAYNWGPGNVKTWASQGGTVPAETWAYQSDIIADIAPFSPQVVSWG